MQLSYPGNLKRSIAIARSLSALRRIGMTTPFVRSVLLVIAGFLVDAPAIAADPASVAKQATAWRAQHEREILQEFADLLAIPNLASDTLKHRTQCSRDSRDVREARPNDTTTHARGRASDRGG